MQKEYIADCLVEYAKKDSVRGHMPGHKGCGNGILQSVFPYDVTELSFSDNLLKLGYTSKLPLGLMAYKA